MMERKLTSLVVATILVGSGFLAIFSYVSRRNYMEGYKRGYEEGYREVLKNFVTETTDGNSEELVDRTSPNVLYL